jgi:hypothetical protein
MPLPDAVGGINLSATSGKIALVAGTLQLSGNAPSGAQVIDFVGYGSATAAEGTPAPSLNNVTAILRHLNGCTDTTTTPPISLRAGQPLAIVRQLSTDVLCH